MVNITLNDYVNFEHCDIQLNEVSSNKVEHYWCKQDILLVSLCETSFFKNCSAWCDLKPIHFNLLILRNFIHIDRLSPVDRKDINHPVVQSLHFLIAAFLKCLAVDVGTVVKTFKIIRINVDSIKFDYCASICVEATVKLQQARLKVVVDNTVQGEQWT